MARVSVVALGTVRDGLGWDSSTREVEVAGNTVGDVLRALPIDEARTLYDFLVDGGTVRAEYMIRLNGGCVRRKAGLDTPVEDGDTLLAMDIVRFIAGG
jgi:sulfur carrier protein ThiS